MAVPTPAVKVDWDANGNYTGTYDDITSDVLEMEWHRGSPDWAGGSETGGATITVRNTTGKYNPDDSGGVLYGNLLPGRAVHITATYSAVTYGLFGGYIDRIIPIATSNSREAQIVCVDVFPRWSRRQTYLDETGDSIGTVGDARATVLTRLGASSPVIPDEEYADGLQVVGADYRSGLAILEDLNRAVGSRHVIRPKATPSGSTGWEYFAVDRTHKLSAAVDETISSVAAVSGYEVSAETVINAPSIMYEAVVGGGGWGTVWTTDSPLPFVIPVGTTYLSSPSFSTHYTGLEAVATTSGGTATVTTGSCGTMARIAIAATVSDVTVSALSLTGTNTVIASPTTVGSSDSTSITAYGEQSGRTIDSTFLRTQTAAKGLADYLLWRYKDPRKRPTITLASSFPTMLARELFDVIALTVTTLSVSARRFEIVAIRGRLGRDHAWTADFTLSEMVEQAGEDPSYLTEVLADSPVFALPMGEASGNLTDLVDSDTATASGTPTYGVTGPVTGYTAIDFDADADYFSVPDDVDFDFGDGASQVAGSLEIWAARDSDSGGWEVFASHGTNGWSLGIDSSDRFFLGKAGVGALAICTSTVPVDSSWHHYVATWPANPTTTGDWKLYVDASLQTLAYQTYSGIFVDTALSVIIGNESASGAEGFPGKLAWFAVYKSTLSLSRIQAHYDARSVVGGLSDWFTLGTSTLGGTHVLAY